MRKHLLAALATTAMTSAAIAGDIDIQVDNFTAQRGISELVLRVTNNTGKDVSNVFIDCVFMTEGERAIDIGKALISSIPAGATKFDKAAIGTTDGVAKASCDVASFD